MEKNINVPNTMDFTGSVATNWEKFKQRFELYLEASEKSSKPDKLKVALLLNLMGDEAIDVYNTFTFAENESRDELKVVVDKFDQYCKPRKNVVYDRFKFFSRSQEPGETVDRYVTELKKLADQTEFLIRDFRNRGQTRTRAVVKGARFTAKKGP